MKSTVIVLGRNYTSRLGMIRAAGMAGYDVVVIKTERSTGYRDVHRRKRVSVYLS